MYVHKFKCFTKPNFSKKNSNINKFLQSFHSSLPKCIKHIKKLNFWKATKFDTQSHVQSLTKICLWCVQPVSV